MSDAISADFVLLRGAGERLPQLRLDSLLLDPQLGKLTLGGEPGQFPATVEQWQSVAALVLLGNPTTNLPPAALANLAPALAAGLHIVLVGASESNGWTAALNLSVRRSTNPAPLQPRPDLWLPFYALGRDEPAARARWQQFPPPSAAFAPVPAGLALLQGDADSPLQLLPHGHGGIIFAGLPDLSALRANGNARSVNRLVAELLELTARPWLEGDSGPLLFPPQPVAGRKQIVFTTAPLDALQGATLTNAGTNSHWLTANAAAPTHANELTFTTGTQKFRRAIHPLLAPGDFALTAHAAPLTELSRLGHGRFAPLVELPALLDSLKLAPVPRHHVASYRLWSGSWPLALLLLLVSAEYLLRRRAGRVM